MPIAKIKNVGLKGICCSLPGDGISVYDIGRECHTEAEITKTRQLTGIDVLYRARKGQTASDLCYSAAEKLIDELNWDRSLIDGLIFLTQTPDYRLPATSFVLQSRLGLSKNCVCLDINAGCPGFVYGLWLASQLISSGTLRRVLVLVGDTLSNYISDRDKSLMYIMSDSGAAAAVEYEDDLIDSIYEIKADGYLYDRLIIPVGGSRQPLGGQNEYLDEYGNIRTEANLYMKGIDIYTFAITEIPKSIKLITELMGWSFDHVDFFFLHQANKIIVESIIRKGSIPVDKAPINTFNYGNHNGVSIPLLIADTLKERQIDKKMKVILAGFGSGLLWVTAGLEIGNLEFNGVINV